MLTGELRNQIDQIWNAFWSGGIANPLEVIEQITYLLFLKRLDDLHTLEENKSARLKKPMERENLSGGQGHERSILREFPLVAVQEYVAVRNVHGGRRACLSISANPRW